MGNKVISENLKGLTEDQIAVLQKSVNEMSEEELKIFRRCFDPDTMGFAEEEGN